MNPVRRWLPLLAVMLLLLFALGWLFQFRLGGGEIYPQYSSLRADALGTRALHDALVQIPGIRVEREYRPLAQTGSEQRLLLLPGLIWQEWQNMPVEEWEALHRAASNGARVVLAFRADQLRESRGNPAPAAPSEEEGTAQKRPAEPTFKRMADAWGVELNIRWLFAAQQRAVRQPDVSLDLPEELSSWRSDLHFTPTDTAGWRVLYRKAGEPVLIERDLGRGSIVLMADAFALSNEAMQHDRATGLLVWLIGSQHRVVFVESTLGVLEESGVGFLARRYGLGGALALVGLLGVLYAWRRMVALVPPVEELTVGGEVALSHEQGAGLAGLLRRSLAPAAMLTACVEEWRQARQPGSAAADRLETAWRTRDPKTPPSATYNDLVRALKPR